MWSDQFYYEDIDGAERTFEFLGDILNPDIFSWVSKVENLDIAVFAGLMQNGIPIEVLPNGEWRKITPDFLKRHGERVKKLLLQTGLSGSLDKRVKYNPSGGTRRKECEH